MNDFISPILKILSTLVSARASVRYVFIGLALIYSWVKIKPLIDPYGLPSQISGIACTFIGIGTGSLAAWLLFVIFDLIVSLHKAAKDKKNKEKDELEKATLKNEQDKFFLEQFKENIMHYNGDSIKILRTLCKRNASYSTDITISDSYKIKAIEGLRKNRIILEVINITPKEYVYTLNPLLKDWLVAYFHEKLRANCIEYLENLSPSRAKALELLENDSIEPFTFPEELMINNYHYSPCIECNATEDIEESFYFEFREDYRETFEEVTGKHYKDFVEVRVII